MIRALAVAILALSGLPAAAQVILTAPDTPPARYQGPDLASGTEATLRGLDKVSGEVVTLDLAVGQTLTYGSLTVALASCRYPAENPDSDAFAFLEISDSHSRERLFRGWMIESSPALSALDHPRYDVWVIRCR